VQSGLPAQERFSLSVGTYNIEGQEIDGTTTTLKIQVADRQGNAVPDGTVNNFTSNGGQVQPSCATVRNNGISFCQVSFSSQNPRNANGRVVILAYAEGVKTYIDKNGNNSFDPSDTLADMGDAYRDDNENNTFDAGEFVLTRGGTGPCPPSSWGTPSRTGTCDPSTAASTVRTQKVLFMASSTGVLSPVTLNATQLNFRANSTTGCERTLTNCLLPMAAGTKLAAEIIGSSDCAASAPSPSTVGNVPPTPDLTAQRGTSHQVTLTPAEGKSCRGLTVRVTATSPAGSVTLQGFQIP
jgi:hypothetical protein